MPPDPVAVVAEVLGHRMANPALLLQALTHDSYIDPAATPAARKAASNERLEFLGDALLDAATGLELYTRHPTADEGALTRAKSALVSRATLARRLGELGLDRIGRVGPQIPPPWPTSVLANLAEAILAAVYLDGGWPALVTAVGRLLGPCFDQEHHEPTGLDAKNRLQILCQERFRRLPAYDSRRIGGSDHDPRYTSTVTVDKHQAVAQGPNRRAAEAAAAEALLGILTQAPNSTANR